jgi:hypothetical protein
MTKGMMFYSRQDREKFFDDTTVMAGGDIEQDWTGLYRKGQDRIRKEGQKR